MTSAPNSAITSTSAATQPLVLEEMLKEAVERGDIFRDGGGWDRKAIGELRLPRAVAENILLRVDRLEPDHVRVLQTAAVLGPSFSYATLATVAELPRDAVERAVEVCVRHQLLNGDPGSTARYHFRHALTREAVYADVIASRRLDLHSRAADAMPSEGEVATIEVVNHLLAAGRLADAVPLCLEAGEACMRRCAAHDAAALYERILPALLDKAVRGETLCRIGEAHHHLELAESAVCATWKTGSQTWIPPERLRWPPTIDWFSAAAIGKEAIALQLRHSISSRSRPCAPWAPARTSSSPIYG